MSTVCMFIAENSRAVAHAVGEKFKQINVTSPDSIVATAVYERTKLVDKILQTVQLNLLEGLFRLLLYYWYY